MYVIEQPLPAAPAANSEANVLLEWNAIYDAYNEVACLILGSMTPELHRQFENSSPYDMIKELKAMFEKRARVERFVLIQTFRACKQEQGKPVAAYVIQMKGYVDQLERLGYVLPRDVVVGLILNGLTTDFSGFVRNYNMRNMGKTVGELHAMLIERPIRNRLKLKARVKLMERERINKFISLSLPAKDDACHHCMEVGHWKRNSPVYLAELLKKKKQVGSTSSSDIFTIELFVFPNKSWVYDTGCGTNICITKQGFREARKLKQRALYLYVGNGVCAQVEAIGSFDLVLPNGLVICLDNCHYAPSILRGFVSVHRLVENGFVQRFTDFGISVSKNNVHYFNVIPNNGIYEIDMHNLVPNVSSIYNVSTKRAKYNLDSTYLWHCRLAHISKKRIKKLQHEGLLKSTNDESFDQCVSFLSGKMTRKSFPHHPKRETDLLGIIHTDVCGPLRHVSKQGASYFITFTDDYSRYGYVYLLKYKHELTPLYTPQHNGVSERRNQSATRILNMVPTKKIDKTPYELWYGKVPNLSYLKVWGCEALVKRDTPVKLQQRSVKYAEFFEKNLITQEVSGRAIDLEEIQDEDTSPSEITSEIPLEVEEAKEHSLGDLNEPTSYKAAMLDSKSNKWIDAINAEIKSMMDNMVWVLVDLPPGCKTVGSKWIFKKKTDMDGIVHTYKARLVAKGYTQLYGVDYEETVSLVADIRAIRILISIGAYYDYEIWQMDIKTVFLNGYLDEDIYMVQPEGFVDSNHPRKNKNLELNAIAMAGFENDRDDKAAWKSVWIRRLSRAGLGIVQ
ncbi:retrotransposon protein, putative, ty1-copia subclass [Tanacetum coccineum]